ncbi:MAG: tRNA-specific 2-thiouridylase MnmA [Bacteroidetes bacterium OLB11]|nr:MAG: tRNA-specific 2-thiouridylase MnmA [Bacteroidetes bacterium OLB11]
MSKKGKILVAMSGGIDSTVAALMLHHEGYEVIGITMKTWDYADAGVINSKKETGCCNLDSFNDARTAAVEHGFPHYVLDLRGEFGTAVIDNFVDEYMAGRTPNPCIMCNTHIKWNALLKRANVLDCEFIATGHYVKVRAENERYVLSKGKDDTKDQSYVLWGLSQECLQRSVYPLGDYYKTEIRQLANDFGYPELAKKNESYEICFVPDNNYRNFLKRRNKDLEATVEGGNFVLTDGTVVGKHKGYPFYTIGQRKGLEIALGRPMYVVAIHPESNTVVIGDEMELDMGEMHVSKLNYIKYDSIKDNQKLDTKIRYKSQPVSSLLQNISGGIKVTFDHQVKGIAPGQSAVFYEGEDVVAGGIIMY